MVKVGRHAAFTRSRHHRSEPHQQPGEPMGLAISVGILADLIENDPESAEHFDEDFAVVNRKLAEAGLPPHVEPRVLPPLDSRAPIDGLPYSFIHYLRRAYAHRVTTP